MVLNLLAKVGIGDLSCKEAMLKMALRWFKRRHEALEQDQVIRVLEAMSADDYSQRIDAQSPLADAVNALADRLCQRKLTKPDVIQENCRSAQLISERTADVADQALRGFRLKKTVMSEVVSRVQRLDEELKTASVHLQASTDTVTHLRTEISTEMKQINEDFGVSMREIKHVLQEKSERALGVLSAIQDIGRSINLLALNASIEAARAGHQGRGFAIVATEIRALARVTMEHAEQATAQLDFADVEGIMQRVINVDVIKLEQFSNGVDGHVGELSSLFSSLNDYQRAVKDNSRIILESLSLGAATLQRIADKNDTVAELGRRLSFGLHELNSNLSSPSKGLYDDTLELFHITPSPAFDLLDDIIARKVLRVAIEPTFIGLSFRPQGGGPLQGLDVEYAQALARFLEVRCEFIETPWDVCTERLTMGAEVGEAPADIVLSGLLPNEDFSKTAFSESYTWSPWILAKARDNTEISNLKELDGKVLGIINDPCTFSMLEANGVRWAQNASVPGGTIWLKNLIVYSDQSRIHNCIVERVVDAVVADQPIYHWACNNVNSPWYGQIDTVALDTLERPCHYAVAVYDGPSSFRLLSRINEFIQWFQSRASRTEIEMRWKGDAQIGSVSYRDEEGNLRGEEQMREDYIAHCTQYGLAVRC